MKACIHCGTTEAELRPYGPGGTMVCYTCAHASPESRAATEGAMGALMDANDVFTGVVLIGEEDGPRPL